MTPGISEVGPSRLVSYSRDHLENPKSTRRFLQLLTAQVVSALNIDTANTSDLPGQIIVTSGDTTVAEYSVQVDSAGIRSLVPGEVAPEGAVIDLNNIQVMSFRTEQGGLGGQVGDGKSASGGAPPGLMDARHLKIEGLVVVGGDKRFALDRSYLNQTIVVPQAKI
jgi:hypothetical protein